jgi:hypothetical protein
MAEVVIDMQEGFDKDSVIIEVGGREVYRKEGVSTRYQIGLAGSVKADCPDAKVTVRIRVPSRGLAHDVAVDAEQPAYVGVSVTEGGALKFQVGREPFGYL